MSGKKYQSQNEIETVAVDVPEHKIERPKKSKRNIIGMV
jgi:hypothetical protein